MRDWWRFHTFIVASHFSQCTAMYYSIQVQLWMCVVVAVIITTILRGYIRRFDRRQIDETRMDRRRLRREATDFIITVYVWVCEYDVDVNEKSSNVEEREVTSAGKKNWINKLKGKSVFCIHIPGGAAGVAVARCDCCYCWVERNGSLVCTSTYTYSVHTLCAMLVHKHWTDVVCLDWNNVVFLSIRLYFIQNIFRPFHIVWIVRCEIIFHLLETRKWIENRNPVCVCVLCLCVCIENDHRCVHIIRRHTHGTHTSTHHRQPKILLDSTDHTLHTICIISHEWARRSTEERQTTHVWNI